MMRTHFTGGQPNEQLRLTHALKTSARSQSNGDVKNIWHYAWETHGRGWETDCILNTKAANLHFNILLLSLGMIRVQMEWVPESLTVPMSKGNPRWEGI